MSNKSDVTTTSFSFVKNKLLAVLKNPFLTDSYKDELEAKLKDITENNS